MNKSEKIQHIIDILAAYQEYINIVERFDELRYTEGFEHWGPDLIEQILSLQPTPPELKEEEGA